MKPRPSLLLLGLLLAAVPVMAETAPASPPTSVTTTKRSAVSVGGASYALVKGTKLEVVSRDGDKLVVKYHSTQGKIPLADTDYPPDAAASESTEETPAPAPAAPPAAAAKVAKPASAPAAKSATPPVLNTSGQGQQPTSNYGKDVQKAKQVSEANKSTHVDPTKDIIDDPKK